MERLIQVGLMSTRVLGKVIYRDHQYSTFVEFYSIPYELMELKKVISKGDLLQLPAPGVEEKHLLDTMITLMTWPC